MKSWAVAGSTPPRRVRREYECMRASRRRDTHSVSPTACRRRRCRRPAARSRSARGTARPARTRPGGEGGGLGQTLDGGDAADLEVAAQHRGDRVLVVGEGVAGVVVALGRAPQLGVARPEHRRARPRAASSSNSACQSGRGRTTTSDASRSCRSSAVVGLGRDLAVHLLDGFGVERADGGEVDGQAAPQRDRVGAAVLQLLVVEEGVRAGR